VANRDRYGIRVLSLPLAAGPGRVLPEDPLRRAVVDAWESGIVVVAAAGNGGPGPVTVASPGDLPHVVTVGTAIAATGGWAVASHSVSGLTLDGFVKPELVAPAGSADPAEPPPVDGRIWRLMGGTSISAGVVAGVAALVLEARPWLAPAEVKDRLVLFARPLAGPIGGVRSIHRQGAGVVDARAAVDGPSLPAPADARAARGLVWSDRALRGLTWSDRSLRGMVWSDSTLRGLTWSDHALRGLTWSD
jgi:serine protease AprX